MKLSIVNIFEMRINGYKIQALPSYWKKKEEGYCWRSTTHC